MFRSRRFLCVLVALALAPLVGCGTSRCCKNSAYSARPAYAAPPCNSCGSSPAGSAVIVGQ